MNKIIFFFFLTFLQISFGQKKYHFDYALEFDQKLNFDGKDSVNVFLINSKENSYRLFLMEKESDYKFVMIDYKGNHFNGLLQNQTFIKAETINIECNTVGKYNNLYKDKVKNYFFENLNDTIINDVSYYHYAIKSNKSIKYQKRKKIVTYHYIIDKNSPDFLPFFYKVTPYNEWLKEKNVPNGKPFMIYYVNLEGEITFKMKLKNIVKIDKYFTIPEECDRNDE